MKCTVLGIVTRKKDDGKISTNLYVGNIKPSNNDKSAYICKGTKVKEIWVGYEVNVEPMDEIDIEYGEGFQGRATIENIEVIKRKG